MLIKNGIVLADQIALELQGGKDPYVAVFHSAMSRMRPVAIMPGVCHCPHPDCGAGAA